MAAVKEHERKLAAENRKARFNYEVLDVFEAGIVLSGTEIKSLRGGKANIADSYAATAGTDMVLYNAYIPEYLQANRFNHETRRPRRLLMHRKEINKLLAATEREGLTVVPLDIHFNDKGRAKVKLALARGKKLHDKRETEKDRDWKREQGRLLKARD
ncbi:MAG: SsrA-binding protein SmpB [Ancalomicrobiaceae bacterium]|nr:SsrA-binding protein SmpB [Ancalomicrobiaceae bacterium]